MKLVYPLYNNYVKCIVISISNVITLTCTRNLFPLEKLNLDCFSNLTHNQRSLNEYHISRRRYRQHIQQIMPKLSLFLSCLYACRPTHMTWVHAHANDQPLIYCITCVCINSFLYWWPMKISLWNAWMFPPNHMPDISRCPTVKRLNSLWKHFY